MIVIRNVFAVLLIILLTNIAFSQDKLSKSEETKKLDQAERYFEDEEAKNYSKALVLFEELLANKPSDPYYQLMVGICELNFLDKRADALVKLLKVSESNPEFKEIDFYLARAYAVNHKFDKAIEMYQKYLSSTDLEDEQKSITRQNIIYCQNAKEYIKDSVSVEIVNIGPPINTKNSEYVPVITPDESMLIYTYRGERSKGGLLDAKGKPDNAGHYYEDIMVSYKMGDEWLYPESIDDNINTNGHNASIAISVDGQDLFIYYQDKKTSGDIYISHLEGENWTKPVPLEGDVNSEAWEGSASLTSDGKILYFVSSREGGFGGRDIYSAKLQPDGSWREVENLGPTINTKFDDDAPFIHPDMKTMYFSSKGHNSMGGYDIFYTYLTSQGWDEPGNVGYPINTIDDDRYYVLSADGKTGYYSTAGRSKEGTHDIFVVSPGHFGKRPILALIVGVVRANGKPVDADITVTNQNTNEENKFESNSTTGKYMLALTPGSKYKIAIEVEGMETKIDYIDVESVETYVEVEHDFKLYSKDNVEGVAVADDLDPLQGKIDNQIEKYRRESTPEGYDAMVYNKVLKEKGGIEEVGVEYFLDLNDASIAGIDLTGFPIRKKTLADGTVEDIIGPFKSFLAAEVARQDLIEKDPILAKIEVKVDNNGVEQTIKERYAEDYKRSFDKETSIHDQLTTDESDNENNKDENIKDEAIDLVGNDNVDLKTTDDLEGADSKVVTGLKFKVEIGAVQNPEDFKLGHLEKYGKITAKLYKDGTTRYTFGPFTTLVEAENFRQMLIEKEKESQDAFVTVFVFGQRKKVADIPEKQREELGIVTPKEPEVISKKDPCGNDVIDFSFFVGKDLNDKSIYNKLIKTGGSSCAEGLEFKVQIAAYRFPKNYKWDHLKQYGAPVIVDYPDGITRFTQGSYNTMGEAEVLRQQIIKSGQKDAWITPFYDGKRMLLEELIKVNFYGRSVN